MRRPGHAFIQWVHRAGNALERQAFDVLIDCSRAEGNKGAFCRRFQFRLQITDFDDDDFAEDDTSSDDSFDV